MPTLRILSFSLALAVTVTFASSTKTLAITPNDPLFRDQWYLRQIDVERAWDVTTGEPGVIVALIDGAVEIEHPDLKGNIWTNPREIPNDKLDNDRNGLIDDVHGWNFAESSNSLAPKFGSRESAAKIHGTVTASLLVGKGNNGLGMAGVAWNARLMPLVVLDKNGYGQNQAVVKAIEYAVLHGAKIINLSLVGHEPDERVLQIIENAAAAGVTVVAATGNDFGSRQGANLDSSKRYPVCSESVSSTVIGVTGTDVLDQHAPYANYGANCTDIAAPGFDLLAARPTTSTSPETVAFVNNVYGTSVAAPLVSGTAALIKTVKPAWTPAQIRQRLLETADPIEEGPGKMGAGRLNAGRALHGLAPARNVPVVTFAAPLRMMMSSFFDL